MHCLPDFSHIGQNHEEAPRKYLRAWTGNSAAQRRFVDTTSRVRQDRYTLSEDRLHYEKTSKKIDPG